MRPGVRLGVDVGKARVGVARSDASGLLATPVETVRRAGSARPVIDRIAALAAELDAVEVVVGLPIALSGRDTPSTSDARDVAALIAERGLPVRLVDERLTTVSAQASLHAAGRDTRRSRNVVDQVAAVILLQHALDAERAGGAAPGDLLDPERK